MSKRNQGSLNGFNLFACLRATSNYVCGLRLESGQKNLPNLRIPVTFDLVSRGRRGHVMMMGTSLGDLKASEWQELQQIADRFEKSWEKIDVRGEPPDLAKFLPPPQDPLRRIVLQELIKIDLEARWRRDQSTGLEFYLQRFQELGAAKRLSAALLF